MYTDYENPTEEQEEKRNEILLNENQLLNGLMELANEKEQNTGCEKIQIKRKGAVIIEFRVRPISEDESQDCWRKATKYTPYKKDQPRKALDTDTALYRSYLIYFATVDEDRDKVWDNKQFMAAKQIFKGVDVIDMILNAGEKARVIDIIDRISGFDDDEDLNEQVKN